MIGTRLSHYEVTDLLGRGGMGEVYRARDTKLGREVALKLLTPEVNDHPERVARFEREARTLASLQHPNIATLHGFEEDQGRRFLVMELVEGQDLSERLRSGALDLETSLRIAVQIAAALESAHEAGIVHRDLKPGNVMLGRDGTVKILDFGLARAYVNENLSDADLANSPTITAGMTQLGTILGTAAYMSPEQARGHSIDRRADLWALGVIVFEMLSGRQLFASDTVSDTLAAVLRADPDWATLPREVPPSVHRFLRRCLQRDPRERLRDAGDARLELMEILENPVTETAAVASTPPRSRRALVVPWLLVFALAALLAWKFLPGTSPSVSVVEFEVNAPVGHAMREFAVSPDGRALVVVANGREGDRRLWLRPFDRTELRPLPGTDDATFPFWSPDSRAIGFFAHGKLRRIDLANENVQSIADAPNGRGGAWSKDDVIVFAGEGSQALLQVSAFGGTPQSLTTLRDSESTHRFPHFAADRTSFTYSAHSNTNDTLRRYFRSFDGEDPIALPEGMSESIPTERYLLYVRESDLVAQDFDPATGKLSGEPQYLASGISAIFPRTGSAAFSAARQGVLAYLPEERMPSRFDWYDRTGMRLEGSGQADLYWNPQISQDLRQMLFVRSRGGVIGLGELWIHDLARGSSRRVFDAGLESTEVGWSHDDRGVLYPRGSILWRGSIDGRPPEAVIDLLSDPATASLSALSDPQEARDGSFIVFSAWDSSTDFDLWILHRGEQQARPLVRSPNAQNEAVISPDARAIAYASIETGRSDIYVCGSESPANGQMISSGGGRNPMWNDEGTELHYISLTDELMAVSAERQGDRMVYGLPRPLFRAQKGPGDSSTDSYFRSPELLRAREGKFLFHTPTEELPPQVIKVVLGWEERLGG